MAAKTYTQLQQKYGGKYIARMENEVVAWGKTFKTLVAKLRKKNVDEGKIVFEYIEPKGVVCVY